jgi:dTDP-4-dehydrorhamnose reductase
MLGELNNKHSITIRTSIVGHEQNLKSGLLEWFLSKKKSCTGYVCAYFSGLTTLEVFNFLDKYLSNNKNKIYGIYNLSSTKISKYSLLKLIAKVYKKKIKIKKNFNFKINRTLNSISIKNKINYKTPTWNKMIKDMYFDRYKSIR